MSQPFDNRDWDLHQIAELEIEIERLIKLLIRAADALEKYTTYPIHMVMSVSLRETGREIITELRKAAEQ